MKILLSNDDGVYAQGIHALADALRDLAEIVIVAPDRNRSGASNSLTLEHPLRVSQIAENTYSVQGTPTDCVHFALNELMKDALPDLVLSGINHGANLGDDVLYSGTVAAAMEGIFLACSRSPFLWRELLILLVLLTLCVNWSSNIWLTRFRPIAYLT